ncbi:MAG: hypothetical protein ACTHJQ_22635 [Rhizobiaceae bacterium]
MAEWWKNDPVADQGGGQFWQQDELVSHPAFDESKVPDSQKSHPSDGGIMDKIGAFASSALEGLPVVGPSFRNVTEDLAALAVKPFSDQSLSDIRQGMHAADTRVQAENPITSKTGGVTGAVMGTIPMVLAAPEAFGAGSAPLWARSILSGMTGAGVGGTDAAVRSGLDPNATANGIMYGGGLGLVAPGVGSALGAGTRALANRFLPQAGSAAERMFARAATADNATDMGPRLSALGPDAMPMDLGPNLQRQAGALAATPGEAQATIRDAIANRQAAASGRVTQAADTALGSPADTTALADDIIAKRSAAAAPLYQAAYAKNMPWTPRLKSLLERPAMRKALSQAQTLAANDANAAPRQFFAKMSNSERPTGILDPSGNPVMTQNTNVQFVRTPNVEELDLTKRALDDMISTAQRQGNNNEARIYTQLKNQLTDMIDKSVPEYAQARAAFSGPSAVLDAMDEGGSVFKNTMTPTQLRMRLMQMNPTEKDAFSQGARAQIADIMGTARNDALSARNLFMKGYNREKLELLVGKDQARQMLNSLDAETAFTKTRDIVTGNSETAARTKAQEEIAPKRQPGFIREALNLRFGNAAADLGDKVIGTATDAAAQARNAELARLLTSNDPAAVGRKIQLIQQAQRRGDLSAQRAKELTQSVIVGSSQRRRPLEITVSRGQF